MLYKKKQAELQREREKEQLEFQREREREQLELQREREQEALKVRERERKLQREHAEKQAAIALQNRRKELDLETTHHTQRKEAEANLQVRFDLSYAIKLMPSFVETENYILFTSFEALANQLSWPQDQWSVLLRCHLTCRGCRDSQYYGV